MVGWGGGIPGGGVEDWALGSRVQGSEGFRVEGWVQFSCDRGLRGGWGGWGVRGVRWQLQLQEP